MSTDSLPSTFSRGAAFVRRCLACLTLLAGLLAGTPVLGQGNFPLRRSIAAPPAGAQGGANLGFAIAINGPYTVVGAPSDDLQEQNAGVVKVFDFATGALLHVIPNPSPRFNETFGVSVAISGNRIVVGAAGDNTGAFYAGSAYVYDLSSANPTVPIATLNNPGAANDDSFGVSVAIDGTRVVVGCYKDDTGGGEAGSAYVYDLAGATPAVPIVTLNNPAPAGEGYFGYSVAISGSRVAVGAPLGDFGAVDSGRAYVYDLNSATPNVAIATLNNPSPAVQDVFGLSVAVSGSRVIVGAAGDNTGATDAGSAYIFELNSPTPATPFAVLGNPSPATTDYFGRSVAITGTRAVVGADNDDVAASDAGSAYVYDLSSGPPTGPVSTLNNPAPAQSDYFGYSVAISGNRIAVGAQGDDMGALDAGTAYLYDLTRTTPTVPTATLNNPGPAAGDQFGHAVAMSGSLVVVGAYLDDTGAPDAGSTYVYDLRSPTPNVPVLSLHNPHPGSEDQFGYAVAISGTLVVVGAYADDISAGDLGTYVETGTVYIYDLGGSAPTTPIATLNNPSPASFDHFGHSVAISGTRIAVGVPADDTGGFDAGSIYIYDLAASTPTIPVTTIDNPEAALHDHFGMAVAMSGARVVVGAEGDDTRATDAGSAYVFDLSADTPTTPVATLNNPTAAAHDYFGRSVAISGTRVVVGAYSNNVGASDAGRAYVYELSRANPTVPSLTLNNPAPAAGDFFGYAVAIAGDRVVVGAPLDGTGAIDTGVAYVYELSGPAPAQPSATLSNPAPANQDNFGHVVAIDGARVVIGVPFDASPQFAKGSIHVFSAAATPALGAQASPDVPLGGTISDNATLSGGTDPTGSISFRLYGPDDATCGGAPVFTTTLEVNGNGNYNSGGFTPAVTGTYRWVVSYSGDANNEPVIATCNAPGQSVTVNALPTVRFLSSAYSVDEVVGSVTLTVTRSGDLSAASSVQLATSDGAALAASDYTATSVTVSFAPNENSRQVSVPITADGTTEGDETFGVTLSDASGATLATPSAATVTITAHGGISPGGNPRQLLNISTRLRVQTGENVLIGGLIVTGNERKRVIIRAIGPSLAGIFNDALQDTTLELYRGETLLARNDDWQETQQGEIEATGIPPADDRESAIVYTLDPGSYTAVMSGKNSATGIGVIEVYDLDQAADSSLINISSRGFVEGGDDVMIGGLIVGSNGTDDTRILVRAIGPSLGNAGVAGALQDPSLQLVDGNGTIVRENDNWQDSQREEIEATTIPPSDAAEAAILLTLPSGNYTAVVRGHENSTGVGLVEVYHLR